MDAEGNLKDVGTLKLFKRKREPFLQIFLKYLNMIKHILVFSIFVCFTLFDQMQSRSKICFRRERDVKYYTSQGQCVCSVRTLGIKKKQKQKQKLLMPGKGEVPFKKFFSIFNSFLEVQAFMEADEMKTPTVAKFHC